MSPHSENTRLEVAFTQQQLVLLQQVLEEGTYGNSIEEVVRTIFRQYSEQLFGKER